MDEIDPRRTQYIHEPLIGENLERAYWANQPCKVMPWHLTNAAVVASILAAVGYVGWQIIKMGMLV